MWSVFEQCCGNAKIWLFSPSCSDSDLPGQPSRHIRSYLSAHMKAKGPIFLHGGRKADQTGQMLRLVCVFTGRKHQIGFPQGMAQLK